MDLALSVLLSNDLQDIISYEVRMRIPEALQKTIRDAEKKTATNTKFLFTIGFNYGGAWDSTQGFSHLAELVSSNEATDEANS